MSLMSDFRDFAVKGNVIDLAVAVIIGAAFGKIVDSLVKQIIMPLVGVVLPGKQGYLDWKWVINGKDIPYGLFLGEVVNFVIVALALFLFIVKFLGWLIGAGITPHIPVWDKSTREDGTLSRSDFRWHKRRGVYVCPNNKVLHTSVTVHDGRTLLYRASKLDCDICPLKARCCPGQLARKIPRDVHEDARDMARRLMGSKAFMKSRDERKRVEMRFAHLKIQHGFERMRLRGLSGARDEFHLAAIVQNLKTLALRAVGPPAPLHSASFA